MFVRKIHLPTCLTDSQEHLVEPVIAEYILNHISKQREFLSALFKENVSIKEQVKQQKCACDEIILAPEKKIHI